MTNALPSSADTAKEEELPGRSHRSGPAKFGEPVSDSP